MPNASVAVRRSAVITSWEKYGRDHAEQAAHVRGCVSFGGLELAAPWPWNRSVSEKAGHSRALGQPPAEL